MFHVPEDFEYQLAPLSSDASFGNNGVFFINRPPKIMGNIFTVIASDGMGWEHVSVSLTHRCPTWEEMCYIKHLFWDNTDTVIQYYPPESEYVNNHQYCLHLWRKVGYEFPLPPAILVGLKK